VLVITVPTLLVYGLTKICARALERRYKITENIVITDPVSYRAQREEQVYWRLGLVCGGILYLLFWSVLFHDDPRAVDPIHFIQHIFHLQDDIYRRQLLGPLFVGTMTTLLFGLLAAILGVIVGGAAALVANRLYIARRTLWLISTLTQ